MTFSAGQLAVTKIRNIQSKWNGRQYWEQWLTLPLLNEEFYLQYTLTFDIIVSERIYLLLLIVTV